MVNRLEPAAECGSKRDKRKEMAEVLLPDLPRVRRKDPKIVEAGMGSVRKAAVKLARKLMQKTKDAEKARVTKGVDKATKESKRFERSLTEDDKALMELAEMTAKPKKLTDSARAKNAGRPMSKEAKALRDFDRSLTDDDKALMELARMLSK